LKIVEEPNENFYFILINNSEKKVLSTLKSRCLTFKINFTFDKTITVSNKLLDQNLFDIINHDLISYYNTPGEIVNLINFSKEKKIDLKNNNLKSLLKLLISNNYYKKNNFVGSLIINLIELYILKEYKVSETKNSVLKIYHDFINKVHNMKKYNLDEVSLFLEFKSKLLNE
jgi:DNA polymerase-3 subunit delta'